MVPPPPPPGSLDFGQFLDGDIGRVSTGHDDVVRRIDGLLVVEELSAVRAASVR